MKSTGIVRRVDELGRIVLPIEIRKNLNLESRDAVEIFVNEDTIVLKKYEPACIFCGSMENATLYHGKIVCDKCLQELTNMAFSTEKV